MSYVRSQVNLADIFTKPLPSKKLEYFAKRLVQETTETKQPEEAKFTGKVFRLTKYVMRRNAPVACHVLFPFPKNN